MKKVTIVGLWRNGASYFVEVQAQGLDCTLTVEVGGLEYSAANLGQEVQLYSAGGLPRVVFSADNVRNEHWS